MASNPILGMFQKNMSHTDVERPAAIEPILESWDGDNNPYRGTETHGVPSTEKPDPPDDYGPAVPVPLVPAEPEKEPVPVYIVGRDSSSRSTPTFRTDRITLAVSERRQIFGRDPKRTSLRITNLSSDAATKETKVTEVANPAAGQTVVVTVPAGKSWRVVSVRFFLSTDATVANRTPVVNIYGPSRPTFSRSFAVQTASQGAYYYALAGSAVASSAYVDLPDNTFVPAGGSVRIEPTNIQAGDQISDVSIVVEETTAGVSGTVRVSNSLDEVDIMGYPIYSGKEVSLSGAASDVVAVYNTSSGSVTLALMWETSRDG